MSPGTFVASTPEVAKGILAADRARRLLQRHHGSGNAHAMPRKDEEWKTWDVHPAVLRGPIAPFWICSMCTPEGDWACRILERRRHRPGIEKPLHATRKQSL